MARENARDRILDAAAQLIAREGVMRLTLDAVALEAEVSKGGLLYHFRSKEALVVAMLERFLESFEQAHAEAMAAHPETPGRWTRAYLLATLQSAQPEEAGRVTAALLAAVGTDPDLLEPLRQRYRHWQRNLEQDGLDPALATMVRLAVDGWWIADILGIPPLSPALQKQVIEALLELTRGKEVESHAADGGKGRRGQREGRRH